MTSEAMRVSMHQVSLGFSVGAPDDGVVNFR